MTHEQETVLLIKGTISELPEPQRKEVQEAADLIRAIVAKSDAGAMALALVGAEYAAK